jgi:hypothetical protein
VGNLHLGRRRLLARARLADLHVVGHDRAAAPVPLHQLRPADVVVARRSRAVGDGAPRRARQRHAGVRLRPARVALGRPLRDEPDGHPDPDRRWARHAGARPPDRRPAPDHPRLHALVRPVPGGGHARARPRPELQLGAGAVLRRRAWRQRRVDQAPPGGDLGRRPARVLRLHRGGAKRRRPHLRRGGRGQGRAAEHARHGRRPTSGRSSTPPASSRCPTASRGSRWSPTCARRRRPSSASWLAT